jgi:phosphoglycerate dehydrogenase-like enzyme
MAAVSVVVTSGIGPELLRQIVSASPRIKVTDASNLFRGELKGEAAARAKLDALLAKAEVIYGLRLPQNVLTRAPRLKWIQVMSAGVDRFLDIDMIDSPVTLTNVSGIHAIPISEFVIGLMLMFVKQAPFCFQLKCEKKWERFTPEALNSKTVGVVGLGSIGREVARLAKALGMRVMATRRSARQVGRARYVDIMLPPEQLNRLLVESDFVVLAVPFTPETSNLIGRKELRRMRPTACLINIARGGIVDEAALVRALEERWIAGAPLDVFATEPLPPDSRLWELPNVIFSPHIAGGMGDYVAHATEIFAENLKRYLAGKRLLNVVDKKRGY